MISMYHEGKTFKNINFSNKFYKLFIRDCQILNINVSLKVTTKNCIICSVKNN